MSSPTPIQGLLAVEAGFLVGLKQLIPEHTVSLFKGVIRVRVKHFPAIFVLANMLSGPLLGTDTAFWLSLTGFLVSWIYLRFFRISEITSTATGEGSKMMATSQPWTGEEQTQDTVLRMLDDARKPLKPEFRGKFELPAIDTRIKRQPVVKPGQRAATARDRASLYSGMGMKEKGIFLNRE